MQQKDWLTITQARQEDVKLYPTDINICLFSNALIRSLEVKVLQV